MLRRNHLIATLAIVAALWAGCGGGGPDRSGRASIAIEWPEPGRLIPKAANFVRVRAVTSGGDPIGTQPPAVARPIPPASATTTINIDNLPVGENITFRAQAFAQNPDTVGGQIPQASGQQTLLIRNDAQNTFDISMASTVSQVTFERDGAPIVGTLNLTAGEDANVTAQARTATNALVLVDPNNWSWTSGNVSLRINSTSTATGPTVVARGDATVTAAVNIMETESSIPGNLTVNVVAPLYPGAVDGNIAGGASDGGDIASGPMITKAAGDRGFALMTRDPCSPFATCPRREVDIHDADSPSLAGVGNFIPTPINPLPNFIVRNSTGLALAYDNVISPASNATVVNFNDSGGSLWTSPSLDAVPILDITARRSHTYALQNAAGLGIRVTKLRDSNGQIVKRLFAPPEVTLEPIPFPNISFTADDEENIYFGFRDASLANRVVKIDKNGDTQPFVIDQFVSIGFLQDIDFDQGLVYVLDNTGFIFVCGQSGVLVQTIPLPDDDVSTRRMSVFRGQIFLLRGPDSGAFSILKISR